jgi:hypothetical protein
MDNNVPTLLYNGMIICEGIRHKGSDLVSGGVKYF